jgi:hypothetical protein
MSTPNDPSKLPKWAQDEMERLRRDVTYWKAKAHEYLHAEQDPSTTDTAVRGFGLEKDRGLPVGTCIAFKLASKRYRDALGNFAHVQVKDGALEINTGRSMVIIPHVTNVIRIRIEED